MENLKKGKEHKIQGLLPHTPILFHLSYASILDKLIELISLLTIACMLIRSISSKNLSILHYKIVLMHW